MSRPLDLSYRSNIGGPFHRVMTYSPYILVKQLQHVYKQWHSGLHVVQIDFPCQRARWVLPLLFRSVGKSNEQSLDTAGTLRPGREPAVYRHPSC
ncbi:hypothetical protein AAFF_G00034720 [Aldrovandia affinis]|uniref:Uncharacterized protein n=1 Tax=Aldrovandia affinis TaxID=143900 RepID=A0AAD7S3K7_9TELE|nr:hypothetical protein AAFF_G00034720 [Aldrovandia affinis]